MVAYRVIASDHTYVFDWNPLIIGRWNEDYEFELKRPLAPEPAQPAGALLAISYPLDMYPQQIRSGKD